MYESKTEKDQYVLDNLLRQRAALLQEEKPVKKLIKALEEQIIALDPEAKFEEINSEEAPKDAPKDAEKVKSVKVK